MARGQTAYAYTLQRGDVCVSETNKREANHVVEEFMVGNTYIKICDDYCYSRSNKDIEAILNRIARKAQEHFTAAAERNNPQE